MSNVIKVEHNNIICNMIDAKCHDFLTSLAVLYLVPQIEICSINFVHNMTPYIRALTFKEENEIIFHFVLWKFKEGLNYLCLDCISLLKTVDQFQELKYLSQ